MIPKIIWQTDEKPYDDLEPFKKNIIQTWKNLNPGWEHRYVDSQEREKYVKNYNNILYDMYKISSGVNQADIWRMIVVYNNGGVYADMDSIAVIPLDEIITKSYKGEEIICTPKGFQTYPNLLNISNFAAVKNSKTMKYILEDIIYKSKKIIKDKSFEYNDNPGIPVLESFARVALHNIDNLCFINNYFYHSYGLKFDFDLIYKVRINGKAGNYSDLVKKNSWIVY
jgi:hypothetical protein